MERLHGYYFEDLEEGMAEVYGKTITDADIILFSGISGDINPLHLNHDFARETPFQGRIAHGMLTASFISTVIGTKLPGPGCIYVGQNLRFRAPVKAGDTVMAEAVITELRPDKCLAVLETTCVVGDTVVVDGTATVKVPARADRSVTPDVTPVAAS